MKYWLTAQSILPRKMCDYVNRPDMTIAVDWDVKHQAKQNKQSLPYAMS